jgi:D-arabinose 1-dehydrogenase-like Zn-dependent alcohol dehydrogenase
MRSCCSGETLFVNGGSGGVGSAVVQIAKILGARVITTAGSEEKAELCQRLGADHVILYKATGWPVPSRRSPRRRACLVGNAAGTGLRPGDQRPGGPGTHGADGRP